MGAFEDHFASKVNLGPHGSVSLIFGSLLAPFSLYLGSLSELFLSFLGPERVYCRMQLRSAPGWRLPGVLGLVGLASFLFVVVYVFCLCCFFLCGCLPFWEPKGRPGGFVGSDRFVHYFRIFPDPIVMIVGTFWTSFGVHFHYLPSPGSCFSLYCSEYVSDLVLDCILM